MRIISHITSKYNNWLRQLRLGHRLILEFKAMGSYHWRGINHTQDGNVLVIRHSEALLMQLGFCHIERLREICRIIELEDNERFEQRSITTSVINYVITRTKFRLAIRSRRRKVGLSISDLAQATGIPAIDFYLYELFLKSMHIEDWIKMMVVIERKESTFK